MPRIRSSTRGGNDGEREKQKKWCRRPRARQRRGGQGHAAGPEHGGGNSAMEGIEDRVDGMRGNMDNSLYWSIGQTSYAVIS